MLQQAPGPVWRRILLRVRFPSSMYFGHKFGYLALSTALPYRARFIRPSRASQHKVQLLHGPFSVHTFQTQLEPDHNQLFAISTRILEHVHSIDERRLTNCANLDLQQHKSRLFLLLVACMLAASARAHTASLRIRLRIQTPRLRATQSHN